MTSHLAPSDRHESNAHGGQEQSAEERDRNGLAASPKWHEEAKVETRHATYPGGEYDETTRPPMKPDVTIPHAREELQRCEDEKYRAGNYVKQRCDWVRGKSAIEQIELRRSLERERIVAMKRVEKLLTERLGAGGEVGREHASSECRRHSDEDEEDDCTPQGANEQRRRAGASACGERRVVSHIEKTNRCAKRYAALTPLPDARPTAPRRCTAG
jgi:hypothetical protein